MRGASHAADRLNFAGPSTKETTMRVKNRSGNHVRIMTLGVATLALALSTVTGCANPTVSSAPADTSAASEIPTAPKDETLAAMVPSDLRSAGTVRVATNAPYAPYQMFASPGSQDLIGLEIDLGHAIGETLGIPFDFSQQPYDGLIPGLQAGKYDVLMATLFDTAEREKAVDFVNYARSGSGILVKKSTTNVKTLDDLCGTAVGVQNGSLQFDLVTSQSGKCVNDGKKAIDIKAFPAFSDEQLALNSGAITSIVGDLPVLGYAAKQDSTVQAIDDPAAPGGYESSLIGIGIPKEDKALSEAVAKAVQKLMDDGIYQAILDKYGVGQAAVDAPSMNQHGG